MNSYLLALRSTAEFQALVNQIKQHRPVVPPYIAEPDNTEIWKANSMQQKGFDLCLILLGEELHE